MQAVILAAGLGKRLGDTKGDYPKAMVRVGEKRLIDHVLTFLDDEKVEERIVVTGFKSELMEGHLRDADDSITLIHNPRYRDGSIFTIAAALDRITDDFLLMNADHIYPKRMFDRLPLDTNLLTAICDYDRELTDDDMKVKLDGAGHISKIDKKLSDYDCGYIGMTFCPKAALDEYRNGVAGVINGDGAASNVERVLARLSNDNYKINICDASGIGWLEVDTPEDFKTAERALANNTGFLL